MSVFVAATKKLAESAARRMERARDLGYDKDVFHSTNQNFDEVDTSKVDIGFHVGTKEQANNRSKTLQKSKLGLPFESDATFENKGIPLHREGSNIMPLKLRTSGEVLELPDIGNWDNSTFVARALAENKGGNVPEQLQDRAFAISELIEDFMETDEAFELAMDSNKWTASPQNRGLLDELNTLIRDEGFSTIKYSNQYENTFLSKAAPRQEIVNRIDSLSEELATVSDPVKRADIETRINTARQEAMDSQVNDAFSYIVLDPSDVRSTSAAFKDGESKNILAGATSIGLGTVFTAAALAPQDAEAGVVTKAARESMLKYFDEAEVDNAIRQAGSRKSREALTQMPIDDFLSLARDGYDPTKAAGISDVSKFYDLPFLNIRSEDGIANITGHEGRHRARRLKELGESTMPVRIKSDIRWDQQNDPKLWDYEQDYPEILFNEDGTKKSPFPFVQGDSNLLNSSALNIENIPRKTTPTSKQISDDELIKGLFGSSAATAVGVGAMSQSNRTLAGTHPGDNADMSGLTLIPEMVSTVINDVYKYGKQAVTGKQDDGRLMETPESVGDAVAIKDAVSKVADWGLNYRGVMGGTSAMDIIAGAMDAYTGTVRPALISALGDAGTKRLEATGMLASMLLPAKNAKGALDIPEVDRDTKLLQRVGDPKSVNSLNVEFEEGPALLDNPMVKAEDIVNRPYVAGMSDTSRGALETLKSISGSEYNVLMEGGQDYMRQLRNANKGALWASDAGAITGMMNNAKGAMKLPGAKGSPLFFPYQMGGKSTDFATMTTDIMVPYAQRNMSKKDKKLVDKRIRDGAGNMLNDFTPQPDWPGVDSPKAMDWLKQAGTGRKAVVKALDEFRGEGSLNASQARAMIVDPAQINPRVANLQNVGQFDMSRNPMPGQHSTYNTDIMGNHLGRFGDGMNLLTDLNPVIRTSGKDFKQEMISRGHNLEAEKLPAPVGKTMMPGLVGVLDERTVEELVKKGFVSP